MEEVGKIQQVPTPQAMTTPEMISNIKILNSEVGNETQTLTEARRERDAENTPKSPKKK